jgi:Leucine-rich repeat (LRR) protein
MRKFYLLLLTALLLLGPLPSWSQKKTTTQKKPPAKKTGTSGAQTKQKGGTIPLEQIESYRQQATSIIKFFESTLNFLGDKRNPVKEKQVIVTESYLKFCWDSEVQVEDDLDPNRLVPLFKDMPAYLSDVDFFFRGVKFVYTVQDISVQSNEFGQTYFRVTANRALTGMTINGDSVKSNLVRYIEINYDDSKQQLKIVSVYTTKLDEKSDLRKWWNSLSEGWKTILGKDLFAEDNLPMAQVESYNDTVAMAGGQKVMIDGNRFYGNLRQIMNLTALDLSGNVTISDLEPISRLSNLKEINLSGTPVSDLMPLRNTNNLQILDISGTAVNSIDPLRYCTHLEELRMKDTQVSDISIISTFSGLDLLDISKTPVPSLDPVRDLTLMKDLRLSQTKISDLGPVSGMTGLESLNISGTSVQNLDPLSNLTALKLLVCDNTKISSLAALDNLTGIQKVYCDNTQIDRTKAQAFLLKHPGATLVYESQELSTWWSGLTPEWKKIFGMYITLDNNPSKEQLHQLILVDSINLNGRPAIASLAPLSQIKLLRVLQCASTSVDNLDPLKSLTELVTLNASNTKVASLQPLSGLRKLEVLNVDNTGVSQLDPVVNLKSLKFIFADNSEVTLEEANQFFDQNPDCMLVFQTPENTNWWKGLTQAWKDIFLQQINLKGTPDKIQAQQIANLEKLTITENTSVNDLTPVQHLSRLKELQFSGTTVSRLEPLSGMKSLTALRCQKSPVVDLTPINRLSNLKELDFSNSQVEDLTPIQDMIHLETLKFSGTPVKNLKYIQKLVYLKVLEFYNTRVSSLDVIELFRNLESLKIFNTKVSAKKVEKFKLSHPKCEVVFY